MNLEPPPLKLLRMSSWPLDQLPQVVFLMDNVDYFRLLAMVSVKEKEIVNIILKINYKEN